MPQNIPCGDDVILGPVGLCLDGVDLGITNGGVTISHAKTWEDITADQTNALLGRFNTSTIYTITANIRSLPLANLRAYLGQPAASLNASQDTLCITELAGCSYPEEHTLTIDGPGPGCACRTYYFPRVIITPTQLDLVISRDTIQELAMEFTAIPTCPDGNVYCITDSCDQIAVGTESLQAIVCDVGTIPVPS